MNEPTSTPAGWYPDPWKKAPLRFWDGTTWTASTGPVQAVAQHSNSMAAIRAEAAPLMTSQQKGDELERQVARFLSTLGYATQTNLILTGRSGATHEIDVFGEKSDELSTFRVAVECKAWDQPIEKDVVAKFAYVLSDLGIREGFVACLSGYRSGAEVAAREMNVTLWGPDELRSRLGEVALRDISTRAPRKIAQGQPFGIALDQARPAFDREAKGKLGFGGETLVWTSPVWLPVSIVQVALTSVEGRLKRVAQTRRIWNAYELLDGHLVTSSQNPMPLVDVDIHSVSLRPRKKEATAAKAIEEAVSKYSSVSTEAAKERHAGRLRDLGIPAPYRAVPETTTQAFLPFYLGLARRHNGERLIVVDGQRPVVRPRLGEVLTRQAHWVRECLGSR